MIRLLSDAPGIFPALLRAPDALTKYQFHVYVGKRLFISDLVALTHSSNQGLLSLIQEYERSSRLVEDLQMDIRRRLGYGLAVSIFSSKNEPEEQE